MTAQYTDIYFYQNKEYSLIGVSGNNMFKPESIGFKPRMISTACYRGFICKYKITYQKLYLVKFLIGDIEKNYVKIDGVSPTFDNDYNVAEYKKLKKSVLYSGGLLLGAGFINSMYVHMGFQKPHAFKEVKEFIFKSGNLIEIIDHSDSMAKFRSKFYDTKNKQANTQMPSRKEIEEFIQFSFELDYSKFNILK